MIFVATSFGRLFSSENFVESSSALILNFFFMSYILESISESMVNFCQSSDFTIACNLFSIFWRASRNILIASDFVTTISECSCHVVPAVEQVWSLLIFSVNQLFQSSSAHNIGTSNQTSPSNLTSTEWFSSIDIERVACFILCCDKYRYFKYKSKISEVFLWHKFNSCVRNYSETSLNDIPSAVKTSRQYSLNDHWRLFSSSAILVR